MGVRWALYWPNPLRATLAPGLRFLEAHRWFWYDIPFLVAQGKFFLAIHAGQWLGLLTTSVARVGALPRAQIPQKPKLTWVFEVHFMTLFLMQLEQYFSDME